MTTTAQLPAQLPGQLDLLDLLTDEETRLTEGRAYIATEQARTPDTERPLTCPWCGYTSTCRAYNMRVYHCWKEYDPVKEPGVCLSMWLTRNHVRHGLQTETGAELAATLRRAYTIWGNRAQTFIPPEHWKTATQKDKNKAQSH